MKRIQEDFNLKYNKIEPPNVYIGYTFSKMKFESGKYCWTMSPEQYVKAAVTNVEEDLTRSGKIFPSKMRHVTLDQLCTLVGGFSGADVGRHAIIPGTHWTAKADV